MNRLCIGITRSVAALVLAYATVAQAAPIVDLVGDKDCFGTGAACVEDGVTWLPGGWGAVVQGAGDPAFTDKYTNTSSLVSWTHTFAPGAYSGASLAFRTAGIADIAGPYTVYVDGVAVGLIPFDDAGPIGHILVETFTFAVGPSLLSDGSVTVSFTPDYLDTWAIDFSELTISTGAPEPGTLALLGLGLTGLAALRRRRSN